MLTESDYQKLYQTAFKYAFTIIRNQDDAEDIAQDSILQLFPKIDEIKIIERYLLKIVKHKCYKILQKRKQQNIKVSEIEKNSTDEESIFSLEPNSIKRLLSEEDFEVFCDYMKAGRNIKKYALICNKSYSAANNRLSKMRRNLQANFYLSRNWNTSEKILTYQQYENIRNFLKTIKGKMSSPDRSLCKRYFEELEGEFPNFDLNENVIFNIKRKALNEYNLFVFSKGSDGKPLFWGVVFHFRRNADLKVIKLLKIKEAKHILGLKKSDVDKTIKPEKGEYSNIHYKEIIEIIK